MKIARYSPVTTVSRRSALALIGAATAAGCSSRVEHRGYQARQGDLQKVYVGMTKTEVEGILGSPSTTATINYTGDSYYYISSKVEQTAFFDPKETERQVVAIRFDQADTVKSFGHYGLQDGRIISFSGRKTPTKGREFTILQQIFSNIGRFDPGTGGPPKPGG